MNFVYILYSKKLKKFYVGLSSDVQQRLVEHNSGISPFTSRGIPWVLVHYQWFSSEEDAAAEERFLKTGKGRERRKYLLQSWLDENAIE